MRFINSATAATVAGDLKASVLGKLSARIKHEGVMRVITENFWVIVAALSAMFIGIIAEPATLLFAASAVFITTRLWATPMVRGTKTPTAAVRLALCICMAAIFVGLVVDALN